MQYDFYLLADVDENPIITPETYTLVVNGKEVQKLNLQNMEKLQYIDFTADYEEWKSDPSHSNPSVINFVLTLGISEDNVPYSGYVNDGNNNCIFTISGVQNCPKHKICYYNATGDAVVRKYVRLAEYINGDPVYSIRGLINSNNQGYVDMGGRFVVDKLITDDVEANDSISTDELTADSADINSITSDLVTFLGNINVSTGNLTVGGNIVVNGHIGVSNDITTDSDLSVNGTAYIETGLTVNDVARIEGTLNVGSNIYIEDGSRLILEPDSDNGINRAILVNDNRGNLKVSKGSSLGRIVGLENPQSNNDASNKKYVDDQCDALKNDLISLINNAKASLTEGEYWDIEYVDSGYVTVTTDSTNTYFNANIPSDSTFLFIRYGDGTGGYTNLKRSAFVLYDITSTSDPNINNINIAISGLHNDYIGEIYYARKKNLYLKELADLRLPYSGVLYTILPYDESVSYSEGVYVYYPDVTNGRLYKCINNTYGGVFNPDDWRAVMARDSISEEFNKKLDIYGDFSMEANLDLSNHNIVNVSDPVGLQDAANKSYVDSKGFILDNNGILSWG